MRLAVAVYTMHRQSKRIVNFRNARSSRAALRALKDKYSPIVTGQIAALDAELASLTLGHSEDSCLLLSRFEDLAARLADLGEPIGKSTLLYRFLKSLPGVYDQEVRWLYDSQTFDRADVERRLRQRQNQVLLQTTIGGEALSANDGRPRCYKDHRRKNEARTSKPKTESET